MTVPLHTVIPTVGVITIGPLKVRNVADNVLLVTLSVNPFTTPVAVGVIITKLVYLVSDTRLAATLFLEWNILAQIVPCDKARNASGATNRCVPVATI